MRVTEAAMETEELDMLVQFLKALADPSRLRLMGVLANGEQSVGAIADALGLKDPTVSHHLTRLQASGLVSFRAEGTTRYYRLETDALNRLRKDLFTVAKVASIGDNVEAERWER